MAKVVLPALSGRASGKIGDIVFFTRYGQQIARVRTKPSNPNTIPQQMIRHNLSRLAQAWKGSGDYVMQRQDGSKYVLLKKYNMTSQAWVDTEFDVLTMQEKEAWLMEGERRKGYKQFGRQLFIGQNIRSLKVGENPKRTP